MLERPLQILLGHHLFDGVELKNNKCCMDHTNFRIQNISCFYLIGHECFIWIINYARNSSIVVQE
jgi:hypothetical protein